MYSVPIVSTYEVYICELAADSQFFRWLNNSINAKQKLYSRFLVPIFRDYYRYLIAWFFIFESFWSWLSSKNSTICMYLNLCRYGNGIGIESILNEIFWIYRWSSIHFEFFFCCQIELIIRYCVHRFHFFFFSKFIHWIGHGPLHLIYDNKRFELCGVRALAFFRLFQLIN